MQLFFFFAGFFALLLQGTSGVPLPAAAPSRPMFVFGSSFVDTGNVPPGDSARPFPWKKPYGESWPGLPSGRYSNGHVLSDAIASARNLSPLVNYAKATSASKSVNFAVGESGVLSAYGYPSMSSQIDKLQSIISRYTKEELASALVLYVPAGDDYLYYLNVQKAPLSGIYPLTVSVGKQISADLVRLYGMGLRKFALAYLPPMGCLPVATAPSNFQRCNETWNSNIVDPHNARIFKNILGLRHYFVNGTIALLDLYAAFQSATSSFGLRPCCVGTGITNKCSSVGGPAGSPMYSLCNNPNSLFFWDDLLHPTEAGWQAVVKSLQPSLSDLLK